MSTPETTTGLTRLAGHLGAFARRVGVRRTACVVLAWAAYVFAVELIAHAVLRDQGQQPSSGPLHGFLPNLDNAPPLARWDSVWYYHIAAEGYDGRQPHSRFSPAFLPLYPLAMRLVAEVFGLELFTAGLWVSRLATLAALLLLTTWKQSGGPSETAGWPAVFALLAFPSAFILVSVYSESLFLALAFGAFVLAERRRYGWSAAAAMLTGLTRIHGLALAPAFAVLAWNRRRGGERSAAVWAPAAGVLAAWIALGSYFAARFDDPFRYFTAKREHWRIAAGPPWVTLDRAISDAERAVAQGNLGSLYIYLELPCLYGLAALALVLCGVGRWSEGTYVGCALGMTLVSGSLWGLPRFALVMFPAFLIIGRLHARPAAWWLYLMVGSLMQAGVLINYVNFRLPAP